MKASMLRHIALHCRGGLQDARNRLRPWHVVTLCSLIYAAITLMVHDWDPMSFVIRGRIFDPRASNSSLGYDGQFAYQIARRPLNAAPYLDAPAYRYQRILYPMAARALSLGIPKLLPWTLILVNLIALPTGTALTEAILAQHSVNRWYALTYGLFIGLFMPTRLNLTEPLAYLLVQVGVLAFLRGQLRSSGAAFALAALTREVTLLFPIGYALYMLGQRRWREGLAWVSTVFAPFVAWQVLLRLWLGEWGIGSGGALSTPFQTVPFRGWWLMAPVNPTAFFVMSLLIVPMALAPAVLSIFAALRSLTRGSTSPTILALLLNASIFPFLPTSNVLDPLGLSRITAGLVVAVLDFGAEQRHPRALNYALLWILTVVFVYKDSFLPIN
jgi:hypothetical protein